MSNVLLRFEEGEERGILIPILLRSVRAYTQHVYVYVSLCKGVRGVKGGWELRKEREKNQKYAFNRSEAPIMF